MNFLAPLCQHWDLAIGEKITVYIYNYDQKQEKHVYTDIQCNIYSKHKWHDK